MSVDHTQVHIHHCCSRGCKYGDDDCPVVLGKVEGLYQCDFCTCLKFNPNAVEAAEAWWKAMTPEQKAAHFLAFKKY
jgi:hypothetical protein